MHNTPEQNGVAERLNRTLVKKSRVMLLESNLSKSLWGDAILHANYLKNRTHTRSLPDKTPYEMVHGKKLNLHDATNGERTYMLRSSKMITLQIGLLEPNGLDTPLKAMGI